MSQTNPLTTESEQPTYVILGSGGHTAEMCKIIQALLQQHNSDRYQPISYILAKSDRTSQDQLSASLPATNSIDFIHVPRSRSVGQSWLTSVFTTIWSIIWSCWLVWRDRPQLVLCNGPGTCVPYCYAAYMWRLLGHLPAHSRIVFVESYCRVENLSLSGRLVLPVADMFVVHWPALATRLAHRRNVRYFGRIL